MEKEQNKDRKASFLLQVQFQRNSTWQGTIQWLEENKTQNFRSTLEMLKLMEEAIEPLKEKEIIWEEEPENL